MNKEHLAVLCQANSVAKWNAWRYSHPSVSPDLRGAELNDMGLGEVNFRDVQLQDAQLQFSMLEHASLRGANLENADLASARLDGADVRSAQLQGANLMKASLQRADLRGARLDFANLRAADLRYAQMQDATVRGVQFCSADLRETDLSSLRFENVSFVDTRLPESIAYASVSSCTVDWRTVAHFRDSADLDWLLEESGMPRKAVVGLVDSIRAMDESALERSLQSVWIAHSPEDAALAQKIRRGLQNQGFGTWFYPSEEYMCPSIDRRVARFDRILLLCTRATLEHPDIAHEVQSQLEMDYEVGGGNVVIPIAAEAGIFDPTDDPSCWWLEEEVPHRPGAALNKRPIVDVTNADEALAWKAALDRITLLLGLSINAEAKRQAVKAVDEACRVHRGTTHG